MRKIHKSSLSGLHYAEDKGIDSMYEVKEVKEGRRNYMELLLVADEQEDMIEKYIDRGEMFVLCDDGAKAACIVTREGDEVLEIKNLAVLPACQRLGYGKKMISFLKKRYQGRYKFLQAGTGDSPLTVPFYEKCGFCYSHTVENFFTDHYRNPIIEGGVQLKDMVYFSLRL